MTIETRVEDAPSYPHGFVTGRYLTAVADGPDADRLMDFTPAKGRVVFTPERVIRRHEGPTPALVVQRPVECALDDQGYLTSPGGGRGVYLIAGIYTVRFEVQGATVPGPKRIEVKPEHAEEAPLDLVLAMPEVVPPGSVVVVDETTAQRAEAAAARAESIVTDIESEVRAVVLASPELKGEQGEQGDQGPQGEKGDQGPQGDKGDTGGTGPANTLTIGTVTGGATAAATLTGEAPEQTLSLVLPKGATGEKGDEGPQGPPGVVSSASSYVIVGPGRPDQPSTTAGTITGDEPVGAEYRSTDGASVGAWVWRKRPSGWAVTDGDTGWRDMGYLITNWPEGQFLLYMRRVNATIYVSITLSWDLEAGWSNRADLPVGLRGPRVSKYVPMGDGVGSTYDIVGRVEVGSAIEIVVGDHTDMISAYYTYTSEDVWLDAPAGVPGNPDFA